MAFKSYIVIYTIYNNGESTFYFAKLLHVLAQFARNIFEDRYWMEDVPLIAREAVYQDADFVN